MDQSYFYPFQNKCRTSIINDCNIQKTGQKSPTTLHIHRFSFERLTSKHALQMNKSIKYPFAPDVFSYLTTSYSSHHCSHIRQRSKERKLQRTKHIKHQNLKKQKITNQIIYIYSKTSEIERFRSRTIAPWVGEEYPHCAKKIQNS